MFKSLKTPIVRRRVATVVAAAALATLPLSAALAQVAAQHPGPGGYPHNGRVVIVVPFAAGGATDIVARLLADEMTRRWDTAVVVDNKAGAGGGIGTEFVARARPDGYTLLLGTQTALSVNPHLIKKLSYNVEKDFAPITQLASSTNGVLASWVTGAKSRSTL